MQKHLTWVVGCFLVIVAMAADEAMARKEALLSATAGQLPTDTGSDGKTKMSIEQSAELGAKALKVVFADGDSFGDRIARVKNWKPFVTLERSEEHTSELQSPK